MKKAAILALVVLAGASVAAAQQTKAKPAPAAATASDSGKEMYSAYCGSCHGADAHGNGPATPALKKVPPDLTALAKNSGGKYPSAKVYHVIQGDPDLPAHGSKTMPVWGPIFLEMNKLDRGKTQQRIQNLADYIGTLQRK